MQKLMLFMFYLFVASNEDRLSKNTVFVVKRTQNFDVRNLFVFRRNRCCFKPEIDLFQYDCVKPNGGQWTCAETRSAMQHRCHIPGQNGHFEFSQY